MSTYMHSLPRVYCLFILLPFIVTSNALPKTKPTNDFSPHPPTSHQTNASVSSAQPPSEHSGTASPPPNVEHPALNLETFHSLEWCSNQPVLHLVSALTTE
ncbi:hypothetical protein BC829DRAFT_51999 [Chytridium lagenaria]|nr:hypothetical protein BC829DRAFT_51999 [Chytridium lagenaria]